MIFQFFYKSQIYPMRRSRNKTRVLSIKTCKRQGASIASRETVSFEPMKIDMIDIPAKTHSLSSRSALNRNQIYLCIGTVLMIAIISAIAIMELLYMRQEAEIRVATNSENLAKSLVLTFDGILDTLDLALFDSVDEFSKNASVTKVSAGTYSDFLLRRQKHLPDTLFLRATDEHGDIRYGMNTLPPYTNVSDRDYFIRQRDNPNLGLFIGQPVYGRLSRQWIWPISRRLNKPDGTFAGVVYSTLPPGQVEKMLAQLKLDQGQTISLRHHDFELVAGREESVNTYPISVGNNQVSAPFRQAIAHNPMAGSYVSSTTLLDSTRRTFFYQRSKKYGFLINVGTTGESIFAEWRNHAWNTAVFLATFILSTLLFALLIRRSWITQERDFAALNEAQNLANIGNYQIDLKSKQINASASIKRILGIDPAHHLTMESWLALVKPASRDLMRNYLENLGGYLNDDRDEQSRSHDHEYEIVRANDGQERWLHSKGQFKFDTSGAPIQMVGTVQDITERKMAEDEIRHLAYFDLLTGLPNRRLCLDRLEHALTTCARSQKQGALLVLDLDNFKSLNDIRGHYIGDELLKAVASRLTSCVRACDTVARLGGDEFVVILENLSHNTLDAVLQVEAVGKKILATLNHTYQLSECEHHSTPSIGITLFSGNQQTVDELMKRADAAMYQAKAAGRNTMQLFDPEMQKMVESKVRMESDLRLAIAAQQFILHYQPQVDSENTVVGAEALIRWQQPDRGLVSPAQFIPIAEKSGLILPIGHWVLQTACAQLAQWEKVPDNAHLTLAVNVSARQFSRPNFVEEVLTVLRETGARASHLKLELTEGLLLENAEDVIAKMTALKAQGVAFSLDDFGTGYSSLSYLKRLPLNQLKIDQSFVRDVLTDSNDAAIARTVVMLGQSLGMAVIAEGVETAEQRDFLLDEGCLVYQGYFFSKPLPIIEFEAFLKQRKSV